MTDQPKKEQYPYRTAAGRLAYYRAYSAWLAGTKSWRDVRKYLYAPTRMLPDYGRYNKTRDEYYCDNWPAGWRDIGDAHDVARNEGRPRAVDHTGWFADSYHGAKIIGRVLQLPARNGSPLYVAGHYGDEWDGATLHKGVFAQAIDAALYADECARIAAEHAREDDAKHCAEQQIEDRRADIRTAREACLGLLREMRSLRKSPPASNTPTICNALRARVLDYIEEIKEARQRIAALESNYWLSVEGL